MDGHPPPFPLDEFALSVRAEGSRARESSDPVLDVPLALVGVDEGDQATAWEDLPPILPDYRRSESHDLRVSCLVATIALRSKSRVPVLPSTSEVVAQYLDGRDPRVVIEREAVCLQFEVENADLATWKRVQDFGVAVGRLLDLMPGTPVEVGMRLRKQR